MKNILVFDIGGSSIKQAIFSKQGELLAKDSFSVPSSFDELITEFEKRFNSGNYVAISVSCPGAIDTESGQGYGLTAIDYIPSGGNIKQRLEQKLNVPVAIDNDANCAGLSEVYFNDKVNSVAYIVLGSGVGGSIIQDGKVISGSKFFGGEFGYLPYKDSTYSGYAGMRGLSLRATNNELNNKPGIDIFNDAANGDETAKYAINEYFKAISSLIVTLKYTIDPEAIIFAGAVTNRPDFINTVKSYNEKAGNEKWMIDITDVEVMVGKFGSDANLYGAYANLLTNYNI